VTRSIWEGAGTVAGTLAGAQVSGRARGEFNGYGYISTPAVPPDAGRPGGQTDRGLLPKRFGEAELEKFVGKPFWRHEPEAYTALLSTPVWT